MSDISLAQTFTKTNEKVVARIIQFFLLKRFLRWCFHLWLYQSLRSDTVVIKKYRLILNLFIRLIMYECKSIVWKCSRTFLCKRENNVYLILNDTIIKCTRISVHLYFSWRGKLVCVPDYSDSLFHRCRVTTIRSIPSIIIANGVYSPGDR